MITHYRRNRCRLKSKIKGQENSYLEGWCLCVDIGEDSLTIAKTKITGTEHSNAGIEPFYFSIGLPVYLQREEERVIVTHNNTITSGYSLQYIPYS